MSKKRGRSKEQEKKEDRTDKGDGLLRWWRQHSRVCRTYHLLKRGQPDPGWTREMHEGWAEFYLSQSSRGLNKPL